MKTIGTIFAATFLLLPWCLSPTFGQQPSANSDKKIIITKTTVDDDGTQTTETIVKKGQAAENFDADAYLHENEGDNVDIQIREESADGNYVRITTSNDEPVYKDHLVEVNLDEINDAVNEAVEEAGMTVRGLARDGQFWVAQACDDKRGFLGVEEDSDENPDAEGLVVEIVRCSGAEKAGLKNNDLILSINDKNINRWSDLTDFMANTKPGDAVRIAYKRSNTKATATATLTKRSEVYDNCPDAGKHGFLGVSPDGDDDDDAGVAVDVIKESAAATAGLQKGDVITALNDTEVRDFEDIEDFMKDTKVGDAVRISYKRGNAANTLNATLGESKDNWNSDFSKNMNFNFDQNWSNDINVDVREKPACLGVYSGAWSEGNVEGSKVSEFTEESAARDASMQIGDVITQVNGQVIHNHDELWNEIAKYQPGDKVTVQYLRDNSPTTIEATLKACKDQNKVTVITTDEDGPQAKRQFYAWNWGNDEQQRMRTRRVITIRKASPQGDAAQPQAAPATPPAQDRTLQLQSFRAYPNPTGGPVTIEFRGEAVPTTVTLLDMSGRQLFHEELNAFNGEYNQQFDLNEYAKGTILVQVMQVEKIFTEQIIVN